MVGSQFGPRVKDLVPATGLFPAYLRTAVGLSPAPPVYHVASLLTVLAAIVCPHTRLVRAVRHKSREEQLHLWTFLSGPPNNGKSYSAKQAKSLAKPLLRGRIMAPIGSIQGLEIALHDCPNPLFFMSEAARFLAENRATWMRGNGSQFWCEVFDGELPERNLQSGQIAMEQRIEDEEEEDAPRKRKKQVEEQRTGATQVKVCMLGAAATGSLLRALKPNDWEGGLMSRVMFVSAGVCEDDDDWFDWPDDDRQRLEGQLRAIEEFCAENQTVSFAPEAYDVFRTWRKGMSGAAQGIASVHADALTRLTRHVRVICALYAISCLAATITVPMVRAAMALGDYARLCTLSLPISA